MSGYKLHCFQCGEKFFNKKAVIRVGGMPYCGDCVSGWGYPDEDDYDEEKHRKQVYLSKYGEY